MTDLIADIRVFNRTITRRLGALDESFLGCGLSLGKARLLFEARRGATGVRRLRERLDLDPGQTSRLLRSLEQKGLIRTAVDRADGRARTVSLTRAGRAKVEELDLKSDDGVREWLAPLSAPKQLQLREAMTTILQMLRASEVSIAVDDPRSDDAQWAFDAYARELERRFEGGFDPLLGRTAMPEEIEPPHGFLLIARVPATDDIDDIDDIADAGRGVERATSVIGCVALRIGPAPTVGEIKRMWVADAARGLGLGRRLLEELEARAREMGVERLRLETNRSLVEAQALYRASGYREIPVFDDEPYAHLAFEKALR